MEKENLAYCLIQCKCNCFIDDDANQDEREYVEVLLSEGMSKKDAIKVVCKERKLKKDFVYKQVLDL